MDLLGQFEHLLAEVVEGVFRTSGEFTALDVDRRVRHEFARGTRQILGRVYAPNVLRIQLADADWKTHRTLLEEIGDQVRRSVLRQAADRQWSFLAPLELGFERDSGLKPGEFRCRMSFEKPGAALAEAGQEPTGQLALVRLAGPDGAGRAHLATVAPRGTLLVGRAPGCDVVVEDEAVSARHTLISSCGGIVGIEDLSSSNGLAVNGEPTLQTMLTPGDRIEIGETVLVLETAN